MTKEPGLHIDETPCMETYTGKYVNPLDLKYEDIDIVDIAHHLSLICRFNGACREFYSVAQHSIYVATLVPEKDKLAALLHDAAEAYMGDIIRPVKYSIPGLKMVEDGITARIFSKFKCLEADWTAIREADNTILATESRDLMVPTDKMDEMWHHTAKPRRSIIVPWSMRSIETNFLKAFEVARSMNDG